MVLFGKKKAELLPLITDEELQTAPSYNSVIDYLVSLSRTDYDKMLKVVGIYRTAKKDAQKVIGNKDEIPFMLDDVVMPKPITLRKPPEL